MTGGYPQDLICPVCKDTEICVTGLERHMFNKHSIPAFPFMEFKRLTDAATHGNREFQEVLCEIMMERGGLAT